MATEPKRAAPAEEPAPAKPQAVFKTFKLRKEVQAHGDPMIEFKLREPTGADIMRIGYPVVMTPTSGGGMQVVPDHEKMSMMMSALAVVPPSTIGMLDPRDWSTVATWLTGFFVPDWDQIMSD